MVLISCHSQTDERGIWQSNEDLKLSDMLYPDSQMVAAYNQEKDQILLIGGINSKNTTMIYDLQLQMFTLQALQLS